MKVHNPNNLPTIKIGDVKPFQKDLKDLTEKNYNKLKGVLEKRGFDLPIFVWDNKGVKFLMDGHGRQRVMLKEGWDVEVPYILVEAKDEKEAAQKLLEITSQYQTTTQEGIDSYIAEYGLNEAEVFEATSFDGLRFGSVESDGEDKDIDLLERKVIEVEFESDELMEELYNELTDRGYKCKLLTL